MPYPSLEQFNEALQHPATALNDPVLKSGSIEKTGLGLPLALCGGFALTYTVTAGGKRYAVRCFHKEAPNLQRRYEAIAAKLRSLASPYFIDFQYQPHGVNVAGSKYPVVRMEWAAGDTLGEFVGKYRRDAARLVSLRESLAKLATYLEQNGIAHGDIQPGNLMVGDSGRKVQLIDYDGMFVPDLASIGASELGHRNFQHPKRAKAHWDHRLDRFSFALLDVVLESLGHDPGIWDRTQSDEETFVFRASDLADPFASATFSALSRNAAISRPVKALWALSAANLSAVPSLVDFRAGANIPPLVVPVAPRATTLSRPPYSSHYPVLDAALYGACLRHVGDRVELIGKIFYVKLAETRGGNDYVFINFGPWKGQATKLNIWPRVLDTFASLPSDAWVGKWVTVTGLLEPPYESARYHYSHIAITIGKESEIRFLTEDEALYRLGRKGPGSSTRQGTTSNIEILERIRPGPSSGSPVSQRGHAAPPRTPNQDVLAKMAPTSRPPSGPARPTIPSSPKATSSGSSGNAGCVWSVFVVILLIILMSL